MSESLKELAAPTTGAAPNRRPPEWARRLMASGIAPQRVGSAGEVLVWGVKDDTSGATISDQFKLHAEDYHQRYAASDHFEILFRQALAATGIKVADAPLMLDLGSGSGVNSVVPCRRLFPGVRAIATDLSGELLEVLAAVMRAENAADEVLCVVMDAMREHVVPGGFDLVTGASILHHLERPGEGILAAGRALKPGGHAIFFEPFLGWALVRLAFERILAEAGLRSDPLDPAVQDCLERLVKDIRVRSAPQPETPAFAAMDDKWLFSRDVIERLARDAGFSDVRFVPHNDHPTLFRDVATVQLRLSTGRSDLTLPEWATAVLDGFDAALPGLAKRELMLEGTVVLTKGRAEPRGLARVRQWMAGA